MDGPVSASGVRLATGPVSWGVDFADEPANPAWSRVLDEIAASGFEWTELGPVGYLPEDPAVLRRELSDRGLSVAGSFLFQPLGSREGRTAVLEVARRTCQLIAGVGGGNLVVIDLVDEGRARTAGRPEAAARLDEHGWSELMAGVEAVARVASEEFGLRAVLHHHAGSHIEFEDEIARALADLDPALIGLCVDTGHAAYAGVDPLELIARHGDRVDYLHLKDVDPAALDRVRGESLDFWAAIEAGVFCPLGAGAVDFAALAELLAGVGFAGPATVEQDRNRRPGSNALADTVRSREFLEELWASRS
jgi:inosose dehydratase